MNTSGLYSLLKVGALTFAGAFLGALTMTGGMPTTLDGFKACVLPALGSAVAAEIYYLRTQAAAALTAAGQQANPPTGQAPAASTAVKS